MFALLALLASSQLPGTAETHPPITWKQCTKAGCSSQRGGIVLDSEWRPVVDAQGRNCLKDSYNNFDPAVCSGEVDCSQKCRLDGGDYVGNGISTTGDSVKLKLVSPGGGIGSRVDRFDETAGTYVNFHPLNRELAFDIDTSKVGCAVNGALYFSEMDADGGMARFPNNKAGAKYGTGYCDAQCPKDGKFVGNFANAGRKYGSCCFEFDIWEGNVGATQIAPHPCLLDGPAYACAGDCHKCDTDGCGWNPYALGGKTFYGPKMTVDTNTKFTVVTQFITDSGTDTGNLKEVRRLYVQGGKVIKNYQYYADMWVDGKQTKVLYDSVSDAYCDGPSPDHAHKNNGGFAAWTKSFKRGAVLVMSLWTDGQMNWLDAGDKGLCPYGKGRDATIAENKDGYVEFSNIRWGAIDSTY
jgi:cellulose 1,4-beta-cellobiosidase